MRRHFFPAVLMLLSTSATAGEADVIDVTIRALTDTSFRINATLEHADTGWEHYADAWDVLDADGNVLGTRVLYHPHVDEQPFTRSLTLTIPKSVKTVTIRAKDSKHEYGGKSMSVKVPR
ncbi:MAG: hypothetical protein AAF420_09515 [Pseudomonadota bacterium]